MFSIRNIILSHLVVGIAFNTLAWYAIKRQAYQITPEILHDGGETNLRGSRHNKSLASRSMPAFVIFVYAWGLVLVVWILRTSGKLGGWEKWGGC